MTRREDAKAREHLIELLGPGGAHADFDAAVGGLADGFRGLVVHGLPYSPWMLLEHIRIAQLDILEFCRNPDYEELYWPRAFWPASPEPPKPDSWERSVESFRRDREEMIAIVADEATDLLAPIPHGQGHTILREAMLVADHTAYHLGELVVLRRLMGAWKRS